MNKDEILQKLKSVALSIKVHPDNQENSEFEDQLSSLEEVIECLDKESPTPVDDVVDVAANVMNNFLQDKPNNGKVFSISKIRSIFRLLNEEEISFSRFVELLNERASLQPEVDALKCEVSGAKSLAEGLGYKYEASQEENAQLKKDLDFVSQSAANRIDKLNYENAQLKKRVEELEVLIGEFEKKIVMYQGYTNL